MKSDQQLADYLREISIFAITHGGTKCFSGWPMHIVFKYLTAHYFNDSLFVTQETGETKGLCVAWKDENDDLHVREVITSRKYAKPVFDAVLSAYGAIGRVFTCGATKDAPKLVEISKEALNRFARNYSTLTVKQ